MHSDNSRQSPQSPPQGTPIVLFTPPSPKRVVSMPGSRVSATLYPLQHQQQLHQQQLQLQQQHHVPLNPDHLQQESPHIHSAAIDLSVAVSLQRIEEEIIDNRRQQLQLITTQQTLMAMAATQRQQMLKDSAAAGVFLSLEHTYKPQRQQQQYHQQQQQRVNFEEEGVWMARGLSTSSLGFHNERDQNHLQWRRSLQQQV